MALDGLRHVRRDERAAPAGKARRWVKDDGSGLSSTGLGLVRPAYGYPLGRRGGQTPLAGRRTLTVGRTGRGRPTYPTHGEALLTRDARRAAGFGLAHRASLIQ